MKLGIMTDIHNNIIALKAIINKFKEEECEGIICAGDIIGIGPSPDKTVKELMKLDNLLACVQGNHERYLTEGIPKDSKMRDRERNYHKWEHSMLSKESKLFLNNLPFEQWLKINGKSIYISHYPLSDENHYMSFFRNPQTEKLDEIYSEINADIVVYGHDHKEFIKSGDKEYINPGSLGCPGSSINIARAVILNITEEVSIKHITIKYDVDSIIEEIDRIDFPAKEEIKKIFYGVE